MGLTFTADVYAEMRDMLKKIPTALKDLKDPDVIPRWHYADSPYKFYIAAAATPDDRRGIRRLPARRRREAPRCRPARCRRAPGADRGGGRRRQLGALYLDGLEQAGQLRPEDTPPEVHTMPIVSSLTSVLTAGLLGIDTEGEILQGDLVEILRQGAGVVRRHPGRPRRRQCAAHAADFDLGLSHETHFEAFWVQAGIGMEEDKAPVQAPNLQDYFGLTGTRSDAVRMIGPGGLRHGELHPDRYAPALYDHLRKPGRPAISRSSGSRSTRISTTHLDVRSFLLGDIALGDLQVHLPGNLASFSGDFDFTAERGFVLRVVAGVDVVSGIALWTFTAIDPETGLIFSDPAKGLLLPNTDRAQAGSVSYTITPWPLYTEDLTLTTGTKISASARIIYDGGTPRTRTSTRPRST